MTTVLVTCVGSGVGQSVIDSLNLTRTFKIIGCDGNPNVYAHSYCDEFFVVPGLYSEGYTEYILELCIANNVNILVPGHDHELVLFGRAIDKFHENSIEVIVSDPAIIEVSRDKQEWYNYFAPLGCKIVPTISVREFLSSPDRSILPAIVKPSGGSASQGISIINDIGEVDGLNPDDIIQPYLFPELSDPNYEKIVKAVKNGSFLQMSEISIQLIFNKDSKYQGVFISKNSLKNGVPVFVDPINPNTFEYIDEIMKFVPILESRAVRGPVNIQGRITPNGLYFFEMNMRFTGITGNRALLGFNEVNFLVRNFLNLDAKLDNYAINKVGVRQVACSTIQRQISKNDREIYTIFGGASKIGQEFVKRIQGMPVTVNLIVRNKSMEKYVQLFDSISTVNLISDDDPNLSQVLCQTDCLINFVSALAYEPEVKKFEAIRYIQRMSVLIAKAKITKIVNISSQSVYPQSLNVQKDESVMVDYSNSYSFQKIIIEDIFRSVKEYAPLTKVVSLRLPRVIIPSSPGQAGFFGKMIENYKNGLSTVIANPFNNTNLIHGDDVISAIEFVISKMSEQDFNEVINVSGHNLSLVEYTQFVQDEVVGEGKFVLESDETVHSSSMLNGTYLEQMGWNTTKSIRDIIKELQ